MKRIISLSLIFAILISVCPAGTLADGNAVYAPKSISSATLNYEALEAKSMPPKRSLLDRIRYSNVLRALTDRTLSGTGTDVDLLYSIENGSVTITGYVKESGTTLTIPASIDGYPVTKIGDYAFKIVNYNANSSNYSNGFHGPLVLPPNLVEIGDHAFETCWNEFSGDLVIPDTVTSIGRDAFYGFGSRDSTRHRLILGKRVETIDDCAFFRSCFRGDLILPSSIRSIGSQAFCESQFDGILSIPSGISIISDSAFSWNDFSGTLKIPDSVTEIDNWAFIGNSFSGELKLPVNLTKMGYDPFYMSSYSSIIGNASFIVSDGILYNKDKTMAILCCSTKTGPLVLPDTVKTIDFGAFYKCTGLTGKLVIPEATTEIRDSAFEGCSGFCTDAYFSKNICSIGPKAFLNCNNLHDFYFAGNAPYTTSTNTFPANSVLYYYSNTTGWSTPTWQGYKSYPIASSLLHNYSFICYKGNNPNDIVLNLPSRPTVGWEISDNHAASDRTIEFLMDNPLQIEPAELAKSLIFDYDNSSVVELQPTVSEPMRFQLKVKGNGTAKLSFYYKGDPQYETTPFGILEVTVSNASGTKPVTDIIMENESEMYVGETLELSASVVPADASKTNVCWLIEDKGGTNATITNGNQLTATNPGTIKLTAAVFDGGVNGTDFGKQGISIRVRAKPTESGELCKTYLQHIDMQYRKKLVFLNDMSYPPIPKKSDKDFAAELQSWATLLGFDDELNGADYKKLLDYTIYWPAKDSKNGQILFVDDEGGCTVQTVMAYLAFMMALKEGYSDPLNKELADFKTGTINFESYAKRFLKYSERYALLQDEFGGDYRGTFAQLAALDVARTTLKHYLKYELGINIPSEVYDIPKTVLSINSAENASQRDKLAWYAAFGDSSQFSAGAQKAMETYKSISTGVGTLWKVKSKGVIGTAFSVAFDSTIDYLSDSDERWLRLASDSIDSVTTTLSLLETALEGTLFGSFSLAVHLSMTYYDFLVSASSYFKDKLVCWYVFSSYYMRINHPSIYAKMVDQNSLKPNILREAGIFNPPFISTTDDEVANRVIDEFNSYWTSIYKGVKLDSVQCAELLSSTYVLEDCAQIDYEEMIESLLKTIVDQYTYDNTKYYRMTIACPVTVNIYDANNNLVHSVSSLDGAGLQNFDQYGSYYLAGDNSEIKIISLFNPGYRAEIVPYEDGVMSVQVTEGIGDTTISSERYSGVSISKGVRLSVNNDTSDLPALSTLDTEGRAVHSIAANNRPALNTVLVQDNGNPYTELSTGKIFEGAGSYKFTTTATVYLDDVLILPDVDGVYTVDVNKDVTVRLQGIGTGDGLSGADGLKGGIPSTGDSTPLWLLFGIVLIMGAAISVCHINRRRRRKSGAE